MDIRVMNLYDYEQVYQLWLTCAGMGLNNLDDSEEGIKRFLFGTHRPVLSQKKETGSSG